MSPAHSVSAFLQSIMPAPVLVRSCLTTAALMAGGVCVCVEHSTAQHSTAQRGGRRVVGGERGGRAGCEREGATQSGGGGGGGGGGGARDARATVGGSRRAGRQRALHTRRQAEPQGGTDHTHAHTHSSFRRRRQHAHTHTRTHTHAHCSPTTTTLAPGACGRPPNAQRRRVCCVRARDAACAWACGWWLAP